MASPAAGPQESRSDSSPPSPLPQVTLPKGGGAIRGIGEKFAANPVTGTASLSIPIATSPGRTGFGPQLSISYDSGAGNELFGFGWSLGLPAITRKTDKGLPRYQDETGSDEFLLSGAEDLVPELKRDELGRFLVADGANDWNQVPVTIDGITYQVLRFRPRVEGLFARIERWTSQTGDVHWRSITRDNILTLYGVDASSRIADPEDTSRVFSWLIAESRDDRGNAVMYDYLPDNGAGVNVALAHEQQRGGLQDARRSVNRYLKRIRYGNRTSLLDATGERPPFLSPDAVAGAGWIFEVLFDYGEGHISDETVIDDERSRVTLSMPGTGQWQFRADPFSTYRPGFEVRTTRLCQRVLMIHHLADDPLIGSDLLVRSTDFVYSHQQDKDDARNPIYTFLEEVHQCGYLRQGNQYLKRRLPPVAFTYTEPDIHGDLLTLDAADLDNLPLGLDGAQYQWLDLHGEGIPGILAEHEGAWLYKRNISPISERPVAFAAQERVALKPRAGFDGGSGQLIDLAGDGQPDLVLFDAPTPGLYEHDTADGWHPFRPFKSRINRNTRDPNLRMVDLTGDGHADVLISDDEAFSWHPSLSEEGFGPATRVTHAFDEANGPRLVFAESTQSIHLADLNGDGLSDLVRIRNGEVCYWPNLGYGHFGAKIVMDDAPLFDAPDQFDPKRLRLADIDGSGTTDIIYLHRDGVRISFNQSGNAWSPSQPLPVALPIDDLTSVMPLDLKGNGTACLVWSSPLPSDARRQMRYIDLMGSQKPHLLIGVVNNLGAETHMEYAPSTKFYLQDRRDGRPWLTRLPFPVHVVERVETLDRISGNRFVTRYAYHHGYFDGEEREFRGFGMVEQWDTEEWDAFAEPHSDDGKVTNADPASHVPPVLTRTWHHTGTWFDHGTTSMHYASEYWREPGVDSAGAGHAALLLEDTVFPTEILGVDGQEESHALTLDEEREACRALKGSVLRQEIYALDGTESAARPFTVTESNQTVSLLQPKGANRHAIFFAHPRETVTAQYERTLYDATIGGTAAKVCDPRVSHESVLAVDGFGNVLRSAAIAYGRRHAGVDLPGALSADVRSAIVSEQNRLRARYTENGYTEVMSGPGHYRTPLSTETRTWELINVPQPAGGNTPARLFQFDEMQNIITEAAGLGRTVAYEDVDANSAVTPGWHRRIVEQVRTLYQSEALDAALPLGQAHWRALPFETYKLALTPGLIAKHFQRTLNGTAENLIPDPITVLRDECAYVSSDDLMSNGAFPASDPADIWWIPSGQIDYSPDPAHTAAAEFAWARGHFFLPGRFRDPFGHVSTVTYDPFSLLVVQTRDPLGNSVTSVNDYRVLQPKQITDPNGNRSVIAFDALGLIVGTAVMGKTGQKAGDTLQGFEPEPDGATCAAYLADAGTNAATLLGRATTRLVYDLFAFERSKSSPHPSPAVVASLSRETHDADLAAGQKTAIQQSFAYSDGFGRVIQQKIQAENGPLVEGGADIDPRWVGTGWTVFNNKGKPVRKYEPFFSATHQFEFAREVGVSPILFYDPPGRVVATLHPNATWDKVVFDPWRQETWDVNDTALLTPTGDAAIGGQIERYARTGALGTVPGLMATYFRKPDLTEPVLHRIDANIQWYWAMGSPDPQIPADGFSVRWTGRLKPNFSERYTFHALTDDGIRLWVNGRLVIDKWIRGGNLGWEGAIELEAGQLYSFRLDYFEGGGNARAVLRWRSDSQPETLISADNFFHDAPTWHALRADPLFGAEADQRWPNVVERQAERDASEKTATHAATPTIAFADTLGRACVTVAHNRRVQGGVPVDELYPTRVIRDIEGNERVVIDALGRVVMRYDYDVLGTRIHQASMEAGERWMLADAAGQPRRAWDSRGHTVRTRYDALRRPIEVWVDGETPGMQRLAEQTVYGESRTNPHIPNLRGKIYSVSDGAGTVVTSHYDFKGNTLRSVRRFLVNYKTPVNWSQTTSLSSEQFITSTRYDALSRPVQIVAPHSNKAGTRFNIVQPVYNKASLLQGTDAWLEQATEPAAVLDSATATLRAVTNIDYDAKGQRRAIEYGNGATTRYRYDPETFRLVHLTTTRAAFPEAERIVQDLHYAYDPAGNITGIRDDAQQTIYFRNKRVEPSASYTYDAIYRLIETTGREHLGQLNGVADAPGAPSHSDLPRMNQEHPCEGNAMGRYLQWYLYDAVGNIKEMHHEGTDPSHPGWTRAYAYTEPSLAESGPFSNRLSSTQVGSGLKETYTYDAHGNMLSMPHLPLMRWDAFDQLQATSMQVVTNGGTPETTYYIYDAGGQRVRKVTERQAAAGKTPSRKNERLYLGGFEVFRDYQGANTTPLLQRDTLHLMDDTRRVALVESRTRGSDGSPLQLIRYQFSNHLDSASLELDAAGNIISYEEYYPYGSTSYQAVDKSFKAAAKRYRYTSKERDEENGFTYHGARYYAPWLGRWTACDPKGVKDSPNLFASFRLNPTKFIDPDGRSDVQADVPANPQFSPAGSGWLRYAGLAIDEPLAVGEPGISIQEAMRRAKDVVNGRQLLDRITNSATKAQFREVHNRAPLPPVSVVDSPSAVFRPSLGSVKEWREMAEIISQRMAPKIEGIESPGKVKEILNDALRAELKNPTTEPGKLFSAALHAQTGVHPRDLFAPERLSRRLWNAARSFGKGVKAKAKNAKGGIAVIVAGLITSGAEAASMKTAEEEAVRRLESSLPEIADYLLSNPDKGVFVVTSFRQVRINSESHLHTSFAGQGLILGASTEDEAHEIYESRGAHGSVGASNLGFAEARTDTRFHWIPPLNQVKQAPVPVAPLR